MSGERTPEQAAQEAIDAYDERRWEPGEAPTLAAWIVSVLRIEGFLEVAERLREVGDECLGSGCECPCHLRLIDGDA